MEGGLPGSDVLTTLGRHRLVPVVVLDDAIHAGPLAQALVDGGLPVAEVTFRTDAGRDSIARMAERGDMLVGAGTVLTPEQVDLAVDAGAAYVVSPGLSRAVVDRCHERGVIALPGVVTPTEIQAALEMGLTTLKFFPARASGGAETVRALSAPFRDVRFVPTGGIDANECAEYLRLPSVLAVGGSWMVPRKTIADGDFERIRRLTLASVATATPATGAPRG
jgi:2-dehydro-3-deoxyphosphogluconate aldolase/(4S)-4-hydroxy-2-oxoglutarate aldolase